MVLYVLDQGLWACLLKALAKSKTKQHEKPGEQQQVTFTCMIPPDIIMFIFATTCTLQVLLTEAFPCFGIVGEKG